MSALKTNFKILLVSITTLHLSTGTAQKLMPLQWYNNTVTSSANISVKNGTSMQGLNSIANPENLDYYWEKEFKPAKVYFVSRSLYSNGDNKLELDSLSSTEVRVDLWNNRVEFNTPQEIKILDIARVSNMLMQESDNNIVQYIHPMAYGAKQIKGLFKVVYSSENFVVVHSKSLVKTNATYVAALDAGSKEATLDKKDHYHIWDGTQLHEISHKKEASEVLELLGVDAKIYFKESKNKLKTDKDFANFGYYLSHKRA